MVNYYQHHYRGYIQKSSMRTDMVLQLTLRKKRPEKRLKMAGVISFFNADLL